MFNKKYEVVNCVFDTDFDTDFEEIKKAVETENEIAYSFISHLGVNSLKVGDWVVVETRNGLKVARVYNIAAELPSHISGGVVKEVVGKVNCQTFIENREREKRKKLLKKEMDARIKKLKEKELYRIMAKDDEELQKLLNEYEGLE